MLKGVCNTDIEQNAIQTIKQGAYNLTEWETPVELYIFMTQLKNIIFWNSILYWYGDCFSQGVDLCSLPITTTD